MMRSQHHAPGLLLLLLAMAQSSSARAEVLFQNSGVKAGWTSLGIQHMGRIDEVATPTFSGRTALRMEQTFQGLGGYHSEARLHEAQGPQGSDVYYGLTFYLPPSWVFHGQNVTFQQWARGDVFGSPWVLMYVENDEIRTGGSGGIRGVAAKITGLQGTWIRVVTHIRHHPTNGLFEVWVNGVKGLSQTGDVSPAPAAPIRWSVGMYCTRWRQEQPAGLNPMVLFHDHQRVATTYEEADPMSWTDGPGTTPPPRDGGGDGPTQPADASAGPDPTPVPPPDASIGQPTGGPGEPATGGSPATGGRGGPPPVPTSSPPTSTDPSAATSAATGGCGCRTPGSGAATIFPLPLLLVVFGRIVWRSACRKQRAQTARTQLTPAPDPAAGLDYVR
jgi:hypothetical protein